MADLQVETDLRSVHSHGTRMIPWYLRSILDGAMNPNPDIRIVQEGPGFSVIDGDNGLGHPPSALAMQMAIEKARSTGIAAAGVRNAGHFGAAACYTMMAVEAKMIGFSTTNTGGPSVAAPGAAEPVVTNNPLSLWHPRRRRTPYCVGHGVWFFGVGQGSHTANVRHTNSAGVAINHRRETDTGPY